MKTLSAADMPEYPEVYAILSDFFKGDQKKIDAWLNIKNPALGNVAPWLMLALGRGQKLLKWMKANREGDLA